MRYLRVHYTVEAAENIGQVQSSKLAGSPKSEASEIMLWTSETILALVRSD